MDERYSLDNLRDIVVPQAPSFWPPAPEIWLLLVIVTAVVTILISQQRQKKRRNAYRHAGLALVENASTVHDISVILKRVALAAFPREQVASLYGEEWLDFLHKTCRRGDFTALIQSMPDDAADKAIKSLAVRWIKNHRVSRPATTEGEA